MAGWTASSGRAARRRTYPAFRLSRLTPTAASRSATFSPELRRHGASATLPGFQSVLDGYRQRGSGRPLTPTVGAPPALVRTGAGSGVHGGRMHPPDVTFKVDRATEERLRATVLPGLTELFESLPSVPPPGTADNNVYATAHGFYCRVARTAQAALQLTDDGFGTEAAPLRRALMEHALALAWVIDQGEAALAALGRAHQARMRSIRDLADGTWAALKNEDFEDLLSHEVPSKGQDHLVTFGQLAKTYEVSSDLLIAWLADTGESHPSYLTARAYWHDTGSRLGTEPEKRVTSDVHAITFLWWLATCEMDALVGWGQRLVPVGAAAGLPVLRLNRKEP